MNEQDRKDFWFARADIHVVRDKELSITARLIFTILCTFADKDTRGCWPSNEAVAEAAGVSRSTVIRACKELEARGVISRTDRFDDGGQKSSYTHIVGHNASCYDGIALTQPPSSANATPPVAPMTHRTRINEQDIKDSLTREAELPSYDEMPIAFENGQPVAPESPRPDNPKEAFTPDDAPEIMRSTAKLFLHETGRKGLTWEEISSLQALSASQYPSRVQKEIETAVKRFIKRGQSLHTLTLNYIAESLKYQTSRSATGRKVKKRARENSMNMTSEEIKNSGRNMSLEEAKRYLEESEEVKS